MSASPADEPRLPAVGQLLELTKSECFELLASGHLGRLAVVDDRGPVVFPVNYVLDRHTVVFRTEEGTKLHAASRGSRVCFEVDATDAAAHTGWSVIVRGEVIEITGGAELARLRELPLQAWAPGARNRYVRILPAVLTGRRIVAVRQLSWEQRSSEKNSTSAITPVSESGLSRTFPSSGGCLSGPASGPAR